jgi:hypothetical protein
MKQLNNRQTESFYEAIHKSYNFSKMHLKETKETLTNCFSIQREEQDFQLLLSPKTYNVIVHTDSSMKNKNINHIPINSNDHLD